MTVLRKLILAQLILLALTGSLSAKEWARKMFATLHHDFGTVARGAKVEFAFELQNIYKEDIHIAGVRSSCGCTSPSVTRDTLKTWEKSAIVTKLNTRSFLGSKNATITVMIDKPFPAEVQLTVSTFIRSDVVLHPGSVEFGEVEAGGESERNVSINYAGRDTWQIVDVETPAPYYRVRLRETQRGNGRVGYEMLVIMTGDAPPGYLTEQFVLVTNDQALQKIPFTVTGRVLPGVTVSPASLSPRRAQSWAARDKTTCGPLETPVPDYQCAMRWRLHDFRKP